MKSVMSIAALAGVMAVSACATVTKGTGDDVKFTSTPPGAVVTTKDLSNKEISQTCVTPCELELNRKWMYDVTFEKEGYKPFTSRLEPRLSGDGAAGMAGNVLIGGIIGAAVDASTGAMNDLKPNPLNAVLAPVGSSEEGRVMLESTEEAADGREEPVS